MDSALMQLGLKLMGYGLFGTFTTLILFIVVIKILTKAFPYSNEEQ